MKSPIASGILRHPRAPDLAALRTTYSLPSAARQFMTSIRLRHIFSANYRECSLMSTPDSRSETIDFASARNLR
jgi:hypothetical protein